MDAEMDILIIPCGHFCACSGCSTKLKLCRHPIERLQKVYKV